MVGTSAHPTKGAFPPVGWARVPTIESRDMNQLSPEELERLAHKRANAKMGWFIHATLYLTVNAFMFLRSEFAYGHARWSVGPVVGWGVGLALHGISVFVLGKGSGLRERMVQKERERLLRQQQDRQP